MRHVGAVARSTPVTRLAEHPHEGSSTNAFSPIVSILVFWFAFTYFPQGNLHKGFAFVSCRRHPEEAHQSNYLGVVLRRYSRHFWDCLVESVARQGLGEVVGVSGKSVEPLDLGGSYCVGLFLLGVALICGHRVDPCNPCNNRRRGHSDLHTLK